MKRYGDKQFLSTIPMRCQMWMHISGLVLISVSIGVMFNARPKDILLGLPVAVLGMWGPFYLGFDSGWVVGTWVTTVLITLYGTWIAKKMELTGLYLYRARDHHLGSG